MTSGSGGRGASGQSGIAGGAGGAEYNYARESAKIDTQCHKTTAGGQGGSGGGGGAGAPGRSGQAYGLLFVCNRNVSGFHYSRQTSKLASCGFNMQSDFINSPTSFAVVTSKQMVKMVMLVEMAPI